MATSTPTEAAAGPEGAGAAIARGASAPNPVRRTLASRAWLKPAVVTGALLPLGALTAEGLLGRLGANPIAELLNAFGLLALALLVMSLACTPLRLFGATWAAQLRKALGLLGFLYAVLHLGVYVVLDQGLTLSAIAADVLKRPFITVGMLALVLLIPLAVTSTKGMVKRLGGARWRSLHRLVYLIVPLGVVHFVLRVKKDLTEPLIFGAIVAVLLAVRVLSWWKNKQAVWEKAG